jgi:hypothetical protein
MILPGPHFARAGFVLTGEHAQRWIERGDRVHVSAIDTESRTAVVTTSDGAVIAPGGFHGISQLLVPAVDWLEPASARRH